MSGGGGGGTKTTAKTPWAGQSKYLTDLFTQGQKLYNAPGPNYYPGNAIAGFNPVQHQAQAEALTAAQGLQPHINTALGVDTALTGAQPTLSPANPFLSATNPWLNAAVQAAAVPTLQELTNTILPSISDKAISADNLGNSREGLAQGLAIQGAQRAIADESAKMYSQGYGQDLAAYGQHYGQNLQAEAQGRASQERALGLLPTLARVAQIPSQITGAVGTENQQLAQAQINALMQRYNYQQSLPYKKLQAYSQIINGLNGGGYGTATQGSHQNSMTGHLEGAAGGAMTGAAIGSVVPVLGTGVGAVVGGLMGAFA